MQRPLLSKFAEKFDLGSTGRLMVGSIVVGFLSGIAAVLFFLVISCVQRETTELYSSAGIRWVVLDRPTAETVLSDAKKNVNPSAEPKGAEPKGAESKGAESKGAESKEAESKEVESKEKEKESPEEPRNPFLVPDSRTDSVFGLYEFPRYWILTLLIPSLGGLFCGLLIYTFAPEAEGEGTDGFIKTYHRRSGIMRFRVAPIKALSSVSTIGSGGSGGWEGPLSLVGAGIGTFLGRCFKVSARERRVLLLSGVSGGIGAIFLSPFGGAFFAAEILYCSTALEFSALLSCILASLIGYATCSVLCDHSRTIQLPDTLVFHQLSDVPWLLVFAVLCALVGLLYVKVLSEFRNRFFARMQIPELFKPAFGGFLVGCTALFLPQVRGGGYEYFQPAVDGSFSLLLLLALILGKMLATAFTSASGGCGGLLAPSLLIGALLGSAFGIMGTAACNFLGIPQFAPDPTFFALIGMGAFLGGIGKIPLTATILVCDMVGSYEMVIPLFFAGLIQIAIHSPRTTLFREQVLAFEDSPVHLGDFSTDLLRNIHVEEACDFTKKPLEIPNETTIVEMMRMIVRCSATVFPVVDEQGNIQGFLLESDVRSSFQSLGPKSRVRASDLAHYPEIVLRKDDNLETALRGMVRFSLDEIPVVDSVPSKKVIGMLRREDILDAYHQRISQCVADDNPAAGL